MSELLHTFRRKNLREKAATLVVTLLVLTLLSTIVVAFVQTVSLERSAARSVANRYQADLAAEAGFAYASRFLANLAANDHFIVYSNTNGQLFIGNGANQTIGEFSYTPLFSTTTNMGGNVTSIVTNGIPSVTVASGNLFTNTLPGNFTVTSPPVTWIGLTNSSGQTTARFAFWVEDLGGRVDLSVAGSNSTSAAARRPTGTNASELAVWSLFNPSATFAERTAADSLLRQRNILLTPATIRLAEPSVTTNQLAEFATRLRHDTNEPEIIPYGFGYANAGQPKVDLNSANLVSIANAISNNLPGFGSRGGALSPELYINSIAANTIDYIDADSTPTAGPGYRGVEPIPFLNERGTWYSVTSIGPSGGGNYTANFTTQEYLEFWNPFNRATPAGSVTIRFTNNAPIFYTTRTNINFTTNYVVAIPSMPPGSYFVTTTANNTNSITVGPFGIPPANNIFRIEDGINVTYGVEWNGVSYDQGRGTLYQATGNLSVNDSRHIVNPPALGTKNPPTGSTAGFYNAIGDPRITFYMTNASGPLVQQQTSWPNENTSFGGRNFQSQNTNRLSTEVFMTNWPDSGITGGNSTRGSPPTAPTTPPALGLFGANNANFSPAYANTNISGRMEKITELGHIFDPLQWGEINQSDSWPSEPAAWTNLTSAAIADARYGGGSTLRIGRPEFTRFTNSAAPSILRASALLDIFAVGQTNNSSQVMNVTAGKININTASSNALRALAAGVVATNDPGLVPSGTNFSPATNAISAFVSGLINARNNRPFFSPSELANLSTDPIAWPSSAIFGNRELMGQTDANDRGTEDWFSKVFPLASVRSRNFLVHIVSQSITTNSPPTVLAEQRRTFQVYLQPVRSSSGTNSAPVLIQSWGL